jgi:hypothetical protein
MIASEETQLRVAAIALAATMPTDFALAGSGAIRAHGVTRRPTADIDLFTPMRDPERFSSALDDMLAQLEAQGYRVEVTRRFELFARVRVTVDSEIVDIDLGSDWRGHEPVLLAMGAVLDEYDAFANKLAALFSRGEARDYLDVDAIRRSGRRSDEELLRDVAEHDAGFDIAVFTQQLRNVQRIGPRRVGEYGVDQAELDGVKARLLAWADELDAGGARRA